MKLLVYNEKEKIQIKNFKFNLKKMNHVQSVGNSNETFLFTSESVGEGHPGKYI